MTKDTDSSFISEGRAFELLPQDGGQVNDCVILLHGLTGLPSEMRVLAQSLHHKGFTCLVPCLSGHGGTIQQLKTTHASQWMEDAERALARARELKAKRVFIVGLSFGGLLGLYAASHFPDSVDGLVVSSVPFRLKPLKREILLPPQSYLPERVLDLFGVKPKKVRPQGYLAIKTKRLEYHSVGAVSRLVSIRRKTVVKLKDVSCPVMILHDPLDHHLVIDSSLRMQKALSNTDVTLSYFHKGHHELLLGHRYKEVNARVESFMEGLRNL